MSEWDIPVGIAAFWFARPQMKWLICGVGIAFWACSCAGTQRDISASTSNSRRRDRTRSRGTLYIWEAFFSLRVFPWQAIRGFPRLCWRYISPFFIRS